MGLVNRFSITDSLKSGFDFYTGIQNTSANINIASTSVCIATRIALASSNIDITSQVFAGKVIHNASLDISITSSVLQRQPIIFGPAGVDSSLIRTLVFIDGKPITNHNRIISQNLNLSIIDNMNWNAEKGRYYKKVSKAGREQFNFSWRFLPNFREKTVDLAYGRDFLASIASDPDTHILKIVNQDESGTTPYSEETYTVFVRSYDETLIRRDLSDGVYYFDCQLSLEEV